MTTIDSHLHESHHPVYEKFDLADHIMVQAVWTREAADPVMNTFCFVRDSTAVPNQYVQVKNRLDTFYYGVTGSQAEPISSFLARGLGHLTYRMRDANAPVGTPAEELLSNTYNPQLDVGGILPPDVAICASYRGAAPYTARRRGRIYIGPLNIEALDTATGKAKVQVEDAIRNACLGLASDSETNNVTWVIASRAGHSSVRVSEGYVDLSFDTQRRRDPSSEFYGRKPSTWTN